MAKKSATKKKSTKKGATKTKTKKVETKKSRPQGSKKKATAKKDLKKPKKVTAKKTKKTKKPTTLKRTTATKKTKSDTKESRKKAPSQIPVTTVKAVKQLLAKGKKQGYLTYDEINELIPEEMLSPEQIDETLIMFDENEIEVIDEKTEKKLITQ
ncbi:MAG: RNA polymerase sigma factor region1.1 domain-containing protein, partial [Desulfobacterales bacterium]